MLTIEPYDDAWPAMFDAEAARLRSTLGDLALCIEHVGSTSVPGLPAKPVIDIQVSVASLEPSASYIEKLALLGYRHEPLGEFDLIYPFFVKPADWPSTHHVHLCVAGNEQEARHLAFRDYLRRAPVVASEYAVLKRALAAANHGETLESRERYSLAKSDFIERVLRQAAAESKPGAPRA